MSTAQSEMWLAQQMDPGAWAYSVAQYFEVRGGLDVALLERAAHRTVADIESLRVRVLPGDDEARLAIHDLAGFDFPVIDLRAAGDPRAEAERIMHEDLRTPFDLTRAPLFRSIVFVAGPELYFWYHRCHHLALDGYGAALFAARTAEHYNALAGTGPAPQEVFPPLAEAAAEEAAYVESARFREDRAFWRERCAGMQGAVSLARQPAVAAGGLVRSTGALGPGVAAGLSAAARTARTGWTAAVIAGAAGFLHRMTGAEDVVLGLAVTGRGTPSLRRLPCTQSDVLPLRLDVRPGMPFAELVGQTSRRVREVLRHQRYRSAFLRRDLEAMGLAGRWAGLEINVMPFEQELTFGGHRAVVHNLLNGPVEDLALTVWGPSASGGMRVDADADENLYTGEDLRAHRMRFERFLGEAVAGPDLPLDRLELTWPEERRLLLTGWNDTARATGVDDLVAEVRRHAATTPHAVAVADDETSLGYAELAGRASALSRRLVAAGARRGSVVAILAGRGSAVATAMLGILGAGAAFLPLDPAVPRRAEAVLADSGAAVLLCDTAHRDLAARLAASAGAAPAVVALDDAADPMDDLAPLTGGPGDLAYVLFTSGSTGRPKGAMVARGGMVNHLLAKAEDLKLTADDSVVQNAPLTFDISIWQLLAPLLVGGRARVVDDACAADPERLFGIVERERITTLEMVPSLLRAALETFDSGAPAPSLEALRWMLVTGEALPPSLCARWLDRFPHVPMVNAYGPTECSDDVTHALITRPLAPGEPVTIGHPIRNTRLYVLDGRLRPVPPGMPGELYVGGAGLGWGYVRDPVRTATAFVPDPFSGRPGARLYRTGDRARHRPDGSLEFLGRTDHQVKIRGQRIELGEVESALRALPGVRDAVASVVDGPGGAPVLAGYLVGPEEVAGLRGMLAEALPEAMIPAALVRLDALPLTPNGKVDRKALPAPDFAAATGRPPGNERERLLRDIFQQVLGVPSVGVEDSFFDLGGNSISSIQLVNRARREGLVLTPREVFQHRTVAELARVARTGAAAAREHPDAGIGPVPLTPAVHALAEAGGPIDGFHQTVHLTTPPSLTEAALTAALQALLDHHDALRLKLDRGPSWRLHVRPRGAVRAERCLTVVADDGEDAARPAREAEAARARLAPGEGIMLQAVWLNRGPRRSGHLALVLHHLAVDGLSWQILLPDLVTACRSPGDARLEPVGTLYRTYAGLLHRAALDPARAAELPLWSGILQAADPPLGPRPLDPRRDTARTVRTLAVTLSPGQTAPLLDAVPSAFHAVTEDVLLTALGVAFAHWRRTGGVLVEVEGHGREPLGAEVDLSRTAGWFTSQFPVRLEPAVDDWEELWSGGPAAGRALKRVKEQLRALPGNGIGFGLLRHLNPETAATLSALPVPQVGFNYLGRIADPPGFAAAGWSLSGTGELVDGLDPEAPVRHVLAVNAMTRETPAGPRLTAVWSWPSQLLAEERVREVAGLWVRALDALTAHAESPDAGGHTASDFGLRGLDQDEIDEFEAEFQTEWGSGT
ncbi:non-ribosomal peptide synthetase [Thermocatellispora tengchongensis]|nr:non-ribosomal peptide synthetase [Thermocatellispora tengchongensis]